MAQGHFNSLGLVKNAKFFQTLLSPWNNLPAPFATSSKIGQGWIQPTGNFCLSLTLFDICLQTKNQSDLSTLSGDNDDRIIVKFGWLRSILDYSLRTRIFPGIGLIYKKHSKPF